MNFAYIIFLLNMSILFGFYYMDYKEKEPLMKKYGPKKEKIVKASSVEKTKITNKENKEKGE